MKPRFVCVAVATVYAGACGNSTGSAADGTLLAGQTCGDWTSDSTTNQGQVGHSDGLGPNGNTSGALSSWNSAHMNQNCANTAPRGGAGRIYCFATR